MRMLNDPKATDESAVQNAAAATAATASLVLITHLYDFFVCTYSSVQQVIDDALRGQETSNYELTFLTKSKAIRYLLVNATTRRDAEGNVAGVVGGQYRFVLISIIVFSCGTNLTFSSIVYKVAQDVTKTKKKEIAVLAIASELRQLVDTANAPIFGIDVHGRVNEWNDKTAEITGFSKDEAWNKPLVSDFIEPAFKE
jgi:PAS domain-containing protein